MVYSENSLHVGVSGLAYCYSARKHTVKSSHVTRLEPRRVTVKASLGRKWYSLQSVWWWKSLSHQYYSGAYKVDNEFIKIQKNPCYKKTLTGFDSELRNNRTGQCPWQLLTDFSPLEQSHFTITWVQTKPATYLAFYRYYANSEI